MLLHICSISIDQSVGSSIHTVWIHSHATDIVMSFLIYWPCMLCPPGYESMMAEWLEQASQGHEMYCHDLEVMSLNPGPVKLGVRSTSVLSCT